MHTTTGDALTKGDVVSYPCWVGPTVKHLPLTAASFVEYPENRVVYWAEGGMAVVSRNAVRLMV